MSYLYDDPTKFEGLGAPPSVMQAKVGVSLSAPSLGFETELEGSQVLLSAPSLGCESESEGAQVSSTAPVEWSTRLIPMYKVSTDKAETMSAMVKLAGEIVELAPHVRERLPATSCGEQCSLVSLGQADGDGVSPRRRLATGLGIMERHDAMIRLVKECREEAATPQVDSTWCGRCA